jgi:hypothetical protein
LDAHFAAIPETEKKEDNEQRGGVDVVGLLPSDDDPCKESKMAALIDNKEETTIFPCLDACGESIIPLHNLKVIPSSCQQKEAQNSSLAWNRHPPPGALICDWSMTRVCDPRAREFCSE